MSERASVDIEPTKRTPRTNLNQPDLNLPNLNPNLHLHLNPNLGKHPDGTPKDTKFDMLIAENKRQYGDDPSQMVSHWAELGCATTE